MRCPYCNHDKLHKHGSYTRKNGDVITQYRCGVCYRHCCDNLKETLKLNKAEKSLARELATTGYNNVHIARILGVSPSTISRWLRGK